MIVKELWNHSTGSKPFSSPVLLVRKFDRLLRICMDYKAYNKKSIKDKFSISMVEELFDELGESQYTHFTIKI